MKNFKVGSQIISLLENNSGVTSVIDVDNIYPLVAIIKGDNGKDKDNVVKFPFAIYRRSNYTPQDTKDYIGEKVWMEIIICAKSYAQSLNIAEKICDALKGRETELIDQITISNLYEDWMDETFVQYITLEVTLKE